MGDEERLILVSLESMLGYHPYLAGILTASRDPGSGPCQTGSLTGAVASKSVSEASKAALGMVGNHPVEYKGKRAADCERDISSRDESRA